MKNNIPESRNAVINKRLQYMCVTANKLKADGWDRCSNAEQDRYIRINGSSMQAVSLADEKALNGHGSKTTSTQAIIKRFNTDADDISTNKFKGDKSAFDMKKERRLQAHIIKESLINDGDLLCSKLFICLNKIFTKLLFVTDEISFGDRNNQPIVRCDIFAVGVINGAAQPVLIELKSTRSLSRLYDQIDSATSDLTGSTSDESKHRQKLICDFVKSITGESISTSTFDVRKILVWPHGKPSKATLKKMKDRNDVLYIEYLPTDFSRPQEVRFSLKTL